MFVRICPDAIWPLKIEECRFLQHHPGLLPTPGSELPQDLAAVPSQSTHSMIGFCRLPGRCRHYASDYLGALSLCQANTLSYI